MPSVSGTEDDTLQFPTTYFEQVHILLMRMITQKWRNNVRINLFAINVYRRTFIWRSAEGINVHYVTMHVHSKFMYAFQNACTFRPNYLVSIFNTGNM